MATPTPHHVTSTIPERQQAILGLLRAFTQLCDRVGVRYVVGSGTAIGAVRHHGFIPWDDDVDVYLLREDYDKLHREAPAALSGTPYRIVDPADDDHYPKPVPHFIDSRVPWIGMDFRANPHTENLKMGIDLLIYDEVPQDTLRYTLHHRWGWCLAALYYVSQTPHPTNPIKNPTLKRVSNFIIKVGHQILRQPLFAAPIRRAWVRHQTSCHEHTGTYAMYMCPFRVTEDDLFPVTMADFDGLQVPLAHHHTWLLRQEYGDYMQLPAKEDRKVIPYWHVDLAPLAEDQR